MKFRSTLVIAGLLLTMISLSCQQRKPFNSLQEGGIRGHVSKLREEFWFSFGEAKDQPIRPTISIHYYNEQRQHIKTERLNRFEDDVPSLDYTAEYTWEKGRPVSYQAVDRKLKPVEKGIYTWTSDHQYSLDVEATDGMRSHMERTLDDKGRISESFSQYHLPGRQDVFEQRMHIKRDKDGTIIESFTIQEKSKQPDTVRYVYAEKDRQGNGTLVYLVSKKTGDTVMKYIRQFDYY